MSEEEPFLSMPRRQKYNTKKWKKEFKRVLEGEKNQTLTPRNELPPNAYKQSGHDSLPLLASFNWT